MRAFVRWVVLAAAVVWCGGAAAATPPRPLAVVSGRIEALAQDGPRLAWIRVAPGARCETVELLDLRTRARTRLPQRCDQLAAVALAGGRVLWEHPLGFGISELDSEFLIATARTPHATKVASFSELNDPRNGYDWTPSLLVGTHSTLVFWSVDYTADAWGGVYRVIGSKAHRFFAADNPLALATAGSEVAELEDTVPCPCSSAPQWSPDGRRIAWTRTDLNAIYVMNADGSAQRRVSGVAAETSPSVDDSPRWSPDGTKVAYSYNTRHSGTPQLHVVDLGSGRDQMLAVGEAPRWSPSGRQLSFLRRGDIWTIAVDGASERRLTTDGTGAEGASWAPDGKSLAEVRKAAVYVLAADGSGAARIATSDAGEDPTTPEWSPSGAEIALAHDGWVAVAQRDGSGLRDLSVGGHPTWSPDGTRLAFDRTDPETNAHARVLVVAAAGGAAREFALPYEAGKPAWSPDGRLLAVGDTAGGFYRERRLAGVYTVAPDGSAPTRLAPPDQTELRIHRVGGGGRSFALPGGAHALAFSRDFFATLERPLRSPIETLHVYRSRTGASVATLPIAYRSERALAISDSGIAVFATGRRVQAFDAVTRVTRTLATARAAPVGLSLYGNRLVWSDSGARRSVVYALVLPVRLR